MNKLVIYYSFSGTTRRFAEKLAAEQGADIVEVKDIKKRKALWAFTSGCFLALIQHPLKINLKADFKNYDYFMLCFPVWAGMPTPHYNSVLKMLPRGRKVEIFLVSQSGNTQKRRRQIEGDLVDFKMELVGYHDIKTPFEQSNDQQPGSNEPSEETNSDSSQI